MKAASRWLPRSLFGRLTGVLAIGLMLAQLLSAAINFAERDRILDTSFGLQPAQRIADVVWLLDGMGTAERERVVAVFGTPPLVLSLHPTALTPTDTPSGWRAALFRRQLQSALGDERPIHVEPREGFDAEPAWVGPRRHESLHGPGPGRMAYGPGPGAGYGPGHGMGPIAQPGAAHGAALSVLRTEVRLRDGRWARFDTELPPEPEALPWRLALTLAVLLASMLALSLIAVRWVVRPLRVLATAAEELGHDLDRPKLPEDGPSEVRQAARAFNTMQSRLSGFVKDRIRILTALSHDLKTPLTRMRLRADLLDDDDLRQRFEADLKEMEAMVTQTLEFLRGLGGSEPKAPVDIDGLLSTLQADNRAMGRELEIDGKAREPYVGSASMLKRCLGNLVDNAVLYGGAATIRVDDTADRLVLHVLDEGPGIPDAELERVFEPFHRLEASRSRATGGTGLGLGIARNIARAIGGDVVLCNRPGGGLDATVTLPRRLGSPPTPP